MSTVQGGQGRIITDGLVLNLDAANRRSYISSNTVWNDLSGNGINGTLNGPTGGLPSFNVTNGGSIVFDGTDDYVSMVNNAVLKPANPTLSVWIKPGVLNKNQSVFDGGYYNSINGYLLYLNTTNQFQFWIRNSNNNTQGVGVATATSVTVFNTSNWYNITGIFNGSNIYIYVNGILENSFAMTNPITYTNSTNFWIGNYASAPAAGLTFQGGVAYTVLYNRALSSTEILQNYNATRARFGI